MKTLLVTLGIMAVVGALCSLSLAGPVPAAVYHMGELSGPIMDSTPNNNDGTYNGTLYNQPGPGGMYDGALGFDGVDDYVQLPNVMDLNDTSFTVEMWFKGTADGWMGLVEKPDVPFAQPKHMHIARPDSTTTRIDFWQAKLDAFGSVALDTWSHLACVMEDTGTGYSANNRSIYVDGQLVASDTWGDYTGTGAGFRIGSCSSSTGPGLYFQGSMDEVRIYGAALDGATILAHSQGNYEWYPIPEPSTMVLLVTGLLGLAFAAWRRRK